MVCLVMRLLLHDLIKKFGAKNLCFRLMLKDMEIFQPLDNISESLTEAKRFTDNFEIQGIEIVANSEGILGFYNRSSFRNTFYNTDLGIKFH